MGLLKNLSDSQKPIDFNCEKCGNQFTAKASDYRRVVYPIIGNKELVVCFSDCPKCESRVSFKCS